MLYDTLYDWQKEIVDKIKDERSYGLFLDMGLGKTILSLALAEANNCRKVIIVTINSKAEESVDEKGSWLYWASQSSMNYKLYTKKDLKKDITFTNEPELIITNYESIYERNAKDLRLKPNILRFIENSRNDRIAIILDESHKIKDTSTLQTKAIMKLKSFADLRIKDVFLYLATGTPFTQGFIDLYSQLKLLGLKMNKGDFIDQYCIRGNIYSLAEWQQPIIGYKNVEELYELIHTLAITIKSEDKVKLPEQIFVEHKLPITDEFKLLVTPKANKDFYEKYIKDRVKDLELQQEFAKKANLPNPFYRNIGYPSLNYFADTSANFWLRARQLSIGFQGNADEYDWYNKTRIEELKKFLENNQDNYVIFYNYTTELIDIYTICEELGLNIDVYCGEIKNTKHYEEYESQTPEKRMRNKKNVIIANYASGSTGKNWQAYNKCILFSVPLYKDYEQSIKRVHRIGSNETVFYHLFYQDNWLDNDMIKALKEKKQYSKEMFDASYIRNIANG